MRFSAPSLPRAARRTGTRSASTPRSLDSLDGITLAVAVEEATGLRISDEALPSLRTVSDIVIHLSRQEART
jgi:acyl carrier protein